MAAVASHTPTPFERAYDITHIPKHDLNTLIMDYFIQQGYPDAAQKFAQEANVDFKADDALMDERVSIREAIYQGDIERAIDEINSIDVQLLDGDKALLFALLRLQLIGLIQKVATAPESEKKALVMAAVDFAKTNLAPYAPQNETFKKELERTMALLIVPPESWRNAQSSASSAFASAGELVRPGLRDAVYEDVNAAILRYVGRKKESMILKILQTRAWAEAEARGKAVELPANLKVSLQDTTDPQSHNGNGDTQMTEDVEDSAHAAEQRYTRLHESSR